MENIGCTDDFSLIREVQSGNLAVFEQLVYAHDQSVLRLALRIAGSDIDAEDIYQETFLTAFRKVGSFRGECAFSTWIYGIATNVYLDHSRKKHDRNETSATEVNADDEEYDLLNQGSGRPNIQQPGATGVAAGVRCTHCSGSDQLDATRADHL